MFLRGPCGAKNAFRPSVVRPSVRRPSVYVTLSNETVFSTFPLPDLNQTGRHLALLCSLACGAPPS